MDATRHNIAQVKEARQYSYASGLVIQNFICPVCRRELETTQTGLREHVLRHRYRLLQQRAIRRGAL